MKLTDLRRALRTEKAAQQTPRAEQRAPAREARKTELETSAQPIDGPKWTIVGYDQALDSDRTLLVWLAACSKCLHVFAIGDDAALAATKNRYCPGCGAECTPASDSHEWSEDKLRRECARIGTYRPAGLPTKRKT